MVYSIHVTLQQRRLEQKKQLINKYDFVPIDSLPAKLSPALIVELDGDKLVPMFQFATDKNVYNCLKIVLPELQLERSDWDICFWLTTKHSVTVEAVVPTQQQIEACKCADEIIHVGLMAEEQSNVVTSSPLELLASGRDKVFMMFYQQLLDLQIIPIPTKPLLLK